MPNPAAAAIMTRLPVRYDGAARSSTAPGAASTSAPPAMTPAIAASLTGDRRSRRTQRASSTRVTICTWMITVPAPAVVRLIPSANSW